MSLMMMPRRDGRRCGRVARPLQRVGSARRRRAVLGARAGMGHLCDSARCCVSTLLLRHRADAGGRRRPCTALRAVLAVGGLRLFGFSAQRSAECLLPEVARRLEREVVRQILLRAALGCKGSRCVTAFSSTTIRLDGDDLSSEPLVRASVLQVAS